MIRTKKDILKWWESLGKKEHENDYKEFYDVIDTSIIKEDFICNEYKRVSIQSPKWKYPVSLIFDNNNECVRILGF